MARSLRRAKESGLVVVVWGGEREGGEEEEDREEGESKAEEWKRAEVWELGREVNGEWREEKREERGGSEGSKVSRRGRCAESPASSCWKLGWKREAGWGGRKGGRSAGGREGRKDGRGGNPGFSGEVEALEEVEGGRRWEEEKLSSGLRPAAAIKERAE